MNELKAWWENLTAKDRQIAKYGGTAIAIILFYLIVWSPFTQRVDNLRTTVKKEKQLVVWLTQASKDIQTRRKTLQKQGASANGPLLSQLDSSLKKNRLDQYLTQINQADDKTVSVNFNQVPFDPLVRWIHRLGKTQGIKATSLNLTRSDSTGEVKAEIVLGR